MLKLIEIQENANKNHNYFTPVSLINTKQPCNTKIMGRQINGNSHCWWWDPDYSGISTLEHNLMKCSKAEYINVCHKPTVSLFGICSSGLLTYVCKEICTRKLIAAFITKTWRKIP